MKGLQYETYHKFIEKRLQNRNQMERKIVGIIMIIWKKKGK